MAQDKKAEKKPETVIDYTKLYVGIWSDAKGMPRAFGANCDKAIAKKVANKECARYEKANGVELPGFAIHVVTLSGK